MFRTGWSAMLWAMFLIVAGVEVSSGESSAQRSSESDFASKLVAAALERTKHDVTYDGSYVAIEYPGGDVDRDKGVCTDVVIRSYRALGIDLQPLVHEDMKANFDKYPDIWGLSRPDPNIDHRRVPNLRVFFARHGESLSVTRNPADYKAGDLVTMTVPRNLPHIGIVVDRKSRDGKRPLIVHNIGGGPQLEDVLFDYPLTGHYRYFPKPGTAAW